MATHSFPVCTHFNMLVVLSSKNAKQGHKLLLICLLDHAYEAPFANMKMEHWRWPEMPLILGRSETQYVDGYKIFELILCSTFTRTLLQKIKHFCNILAEVSLHHIWSEFVWVYFYKLLITAKAKLPNMSKKLISHFDISNFLEEIYPLPPQTVASKTYIWSFQYRVLN